MTNRRLEKSLRQAKNKKQDLVTPIDGILGIPLNGSKVVEVPNRDGFVFVRLRGNQSELIQAYNAATSPVYDLPVLVIRQTGVYKVIGRNEVRNQNQWGLAPYLPKHGPQHSFNPSLNIGGDIVWTYSQQFMPLLAYPSGTAGSPRLSVSPYVIRDLDGNWVYAGNTGTISTIPYNPNTGSRAIMALVYIDSVSGNPYLLVNSGTPIDISLTGTSQVVPYIPRITSPSQIPIAAIRLLSGTSSLTWDNVYDVRPFLQVFPTGSSGGNTTNNYINNPLVGLSVQDDGNFFASGTVISFDNNLYLGLSGTVIHVSSPVTTYQRFEQPIQISDSLFKVPDNVYASGSLGVFYNGQVQLKGFQYEELIYVSGTYHLLFSPATGSTHMVSYGVPCIPQQYLGTTGTNTMVDSFGSLLVDSNGNQLVDSNG